MFFLSALKKAIYKSNTDETHYEPHVTLFVSAYNETDVVHQKIANSFELNYPKEKLHLVWITDGSADGTEIELKKYPNITVYHEKERKGKINAINRGMKFIDTPLVVFSDANSMLNKECIRAIVDEFRDNKTGCVAGEKRIIPFAKDNAVNSGESLYWKYESLIKRCESNVNSAIGAVGELFAIRTELFTEIENDTILDDFVISLGIVQKGFKIKYTSGAFAEERASENISEELKRKKRIGFGAFQTLFRLKGLLNPFLNPMLTFQYISHKVIRWTIIPFSLPIIALLNILLVLKSTHKELYIIFLLIQVLFYLFVLIGYVLQTKKIKLKIVFTPYYIFIMNYSLIAGFIRFIKKTQPVNWERAKRG
jgi:cellulose synthase/poly-beta-1,6-N-acetylglucosamine synthase-like glycosyltransferase